MYLIIIVLAVISLYVYLTWNYGYWSKRGVPNPKPVLFHGNTPGVLFFRRHINYDFHKIFEEMKDHSAVGIYVLRSPSLLIFDRELIKQILISKFKFFRNNDVAYQMDKHSDPLFGRNPFILQNEEWKEKRNQVSPAMSQSKLKALSPLLEDVCNKLKDFIAKNIDNDESHAFDAKLLTGRFTTQATSSCLFGIDANAFDDDISEVQKMSNRLTEVSHRFAVHSMVTSFIPFLKYFWRISITRKDVEDFFMNLTDDSIKLREESGVNRFDFLEQLIKLKNEKSLKGYDLVSSAISIYWDGYETSRLGIALTLYEIAKSKAVQEKLRKEIMESGDRSYDNLCELSYMEKCINEALRIHPPLASFSRVCNEFVELIDSKNKKIVIEEGTSVTVPVYSIHRDPNFYSDPEKFNPDRFDDENGGIKQFRDKCVLMPFGDGPRICLGMRYGNLMVKYFLSEILRNFEVSLHEKSIEPFELEPTRLLTVPKNTVYLKFKKLI